MTTPWGLADFDAHEDVHFFTDEKCGLKAIIAMHSTHLGPAAGGCRFWHYAKDEEALVDALRLSRGMSYKNAMAGLPLGGGKGVILAGEERQKTPDMLHAFGKAVDQLGGRYITAEDVGMSVPDMIEVARSTRFVAGLPAEGKDVGGDPGPHTSLGVFLGIKAAVKHALGKDSLNGLHIALQGAGSVATGVALHACAEGARLSIADVDQAKAEKLADATGGEPVSPDEILEPRSRRAEPLRLGRDFEPGDDRRAQSPGGCGRGEQSAGDAARRRAAARARNSLRARLRDQRRRDHQRLHRISRRWRRGPGAAADRGDRRRGWKRSGPRARPAGAIRRRSPTLWRRS